MIHRFKIERLKYDRIGRYVIKRKVWLLPPIYYMKTMTKNEFFGGLTNYGDNVLSREDAHFKSPDQAQDALNQYAQINGITEVIMKISE